MENRRPDVRRGRGPVLVVDDDPDVLLLAARAIRGAGCQAVTVPGGVEALELFQGGVRPALVILDHAMPGRDGLSVLREIRTIPGGEALPVVMFTTRAGDAFKLEAAAAGATACVTKPADVGRFQAAIVAMLRRWILGPVGGRAAAEA